MNSTEKKKNKVFTPNEKQKILLCLIYMTHLLPTQSLKFFENILTESNLKYKIIPRLEQNGLIERKIYGFSRYGQKDVILKGKALYDSLVLTRIGTSYVLGILGTPPEMRILHDYYIKNDVHTDINMEERFKRTVLTDIMFKKDIFVRALLSTDFLISGTRKILQDELKGINYKIPDKYFFRGIDCKRYNFDLDLLGTSRPELSNNSGNNLAGSKFFGIYITTKNGLYKNIYPVYNGNFYNVSVTESTEIQLKNKLWSETRGDVDSCIYVFQDPLKIKKLLQNDTQVAWQTNPSLYSCDLYNNIYVFRYDKSFLKQIDIFELDKSTNNRIKYWRRYFSENILQKVFTEENIGTAINKAPIFDAMCDDTFYYIGFEQELNSLQKIYDYIHSEDFYNKKLIIICLPEQVDFYKQIFISGVLGNIDFITLDSIPYDEEELNG